MYLRQNPNPGFILGLLAKRHFNQSTRNTERLCDKRGEPYGPELAQRARASRDRGQSPGSDDFFGFTKEEPKAGNGWYIAHFFAPCPSDPQSVSSPLGRKSFGRRFFSFTGAYPKGQGYTAGTGSYSQHPARRFTNRTSFRVPMDFDRAAPNIPA